MTLSNGLSEVDTNLGLIVGLSVGGAVLLAIIITVVVLVIKKGKKAGVQTPTKKLTQIVA